MKRSEKVIPKLIYIEPFKMKKGKNILPFIFQLLLLWLSLTGFVYCIATSVKMPISLLTISVICLPCLLISALFTVNKKLYITFISIFGGVVLCVLFLLRSLRDRIIEAFIFCYNLTIQIVVDEGYTNYKSAMTEDITDKLADPNTVNGYFYCVVIVLIIVFSVLFTSTMMKRSFVWLNTLPCFLVLTPSLYFGAVPSGPAFCLFISGIIGCYAESIVYAVHKNSVKKGVGASRNHNRLGYVAHCAANGFYCAVTVLIVSLSISSVVYSNDVLQIDSVREIIDNAAMKLMNKFFYEQYESAEGAIGGLLDGNVLKLETPNFRELPVMTVTTRTNTSLYLRGWIGDELCDDGWLILDEEDTENYKNAVSEQFDQYTQLYRYTKLVSKSELSSAETSADTAKLGFVYDTVNIKAKFTKSLMMFVPVTGINNIVEGQYRGITTIGDNISFFDDKRPASNSYTIDAALQSFSDRDFYSNFEEKQKNYLFMANAVLVKQSGLNEEEQFMYDERKYKEYVQNTYLSLPQDIEFLSSLAEEITENYNDDFDKALVLERYFKTDYNYARSFTNSEDTPVDKIRYMIETSKTGYCTYYATAMTLMVRSLGIPARYVTGYHAMVVPETGKSKYTREIIDENYHAWVEVYFDGIGWLTFDPTPGIGGNQIIRDYGYLDDPAPDTQEPETPYVESPVVSDDGDIDDSNSVDVGNEMPIPEDNLPGWVITLIVIVAVIVIVSVGAAVTIILINGKFNKYRDYVFRLPPTEMVSTLYSSILRLLGSLGYRPENGEPIHHFADRVDNAFNLTTRLRSIIDVLEMTQFSKNTVDEQTAQTIGLYFDQLSMIALKRHNVFKKYYYMATINKKKY